MSLLLTLLLPYDDTLVANGYDILTDFYYVFLLDARSCIKDMHFHAYENLRFSILRSPSFQVNLTPSIPGQISFTVTKAGIWKLQMVISEPIFNSNYNYAILILLNRTPSPWGTLTTRDNISFR